MTNDINITAFDLKFKSNITKPEVLSLISKLKLGGVNILDIQSIRFNSIISLNHLKSAFWHAWKAREGNYAISNSISIEFILYLSSKRQISKALKFFGINKPTNIISLIIFHSGDVSIDNIRNILAQDFMDTSISDLTIDNNKEKILALCEFFDFNLKKDEEMNIESIKELEGYILSCIANLVFEG